MRKSILVGLIAGLFLSSALADGINIPAQLKTNTITVTRDLTAATGNVAYTGMGFQPTACDALGMVANNTVQYITYHAFSDSSLVSSSIAWFGAVLVRSPNFLLYSDTTATNAQTATIASYDADGFTLAWTKSGTPTGSAVAYVRCFR